MTAEILCRAARGIALVFASVGVILATPFCLIAAWLFDVADDLEGGWRRGREQNWLWRWARKARGQ